jgi:hypothetical protein
METDYTFILSLTRYGNCDGQSGTGVEFLWLLELSLPNLNPPAVTDSSIGLSSVATNV